MKTKLLTLLAALLVSVSAFAGKNVNILIVTGGHEYEEQDFFTMFDNLPGITYTHMEQPMAQNYYNAQMAAKYDVIVFYDMWETITDKAAQGLLDMVKNGKSVLLFHHSICGYNSWPEFINLAGGKYLKKPFTDPATGQAAPMTQFKHDVMVTVEAVKGNGVVKLDGPFTYKEERYYDMYVSPGVKPILVLKDVGSDKEEIVEWENKYGKGTVISLLLGHDKPVYENPNIRSILEQTIKYLAKKSK